MKKTGLCPKCGSKDLLLVPGKAGAYGSGNNNMIGHSIFFLFLFNRYVCCTCGFTEEWVDLEDIPKLKEKYDQ